MAKYLISLRGRINRIRSVWSAPVEKKSSLDKGVPGVSPMMRIVASCALILACLFLGVDLSTIPWHQVILTA